MIWHMIFVAKALLFRFIVDYKNPVRKFSHCALLTEQKSYPNYFKIARLLNIQVWLITMRLFRAVFSRFDRIFGKIVNSVMVVFTFNFNTNLRITILGEPIVASRNKNICNWLKCNSYQFCNDLSVPIDFSNSNITFEDILFNLTLTYKTLILLDKQDSSALHSVLKYDPIIYFQLGSLLVTFLSLWWADPENRTCPIWAHLALTYLHSISYVDALRTEQILYYIIM